MNISAAQRAEREAASMVTGRYLCGASPSCSFAHRHALEARACPVAAELRRARRPEVTAEHHARFARTVAAAMPREGRADSDKSPRGASVFRPEVE